MDSGLLIHGVEPRLPQSTISDHEIKIPLVPAKRLIQRLSRLLGGGAGFRNLPLHLAGTDFILRNAARLARVCVDHWRCPRLQLPRPSCCHQDVSVVAVKAFDQLHWDSPSHQVRLNVCRTSNNAFHRTLPTFRLVPLYLLTASDALFPASLK